MVSSRRFRKSITRDLTWVIMVLPFRVSIGLHRSYF